MAKTTLVGLGTAHDGDTLKLTTASGLHWVRVADVDAPERGQPGYVFTTRFLQSILRGRLVVCSVVDYDRGREVADVEVFWRVGSVPRSQNVGAALRDFITARRASWKLSTPAVQTPRWLAAQHLGLQPTVPGLATSGLLGTPPRRIPPPGRRPLATALATPPSLIPSAALDPLATAFGTPPSLIPPAALDPLATAFGTPPPRIPPPALGPRRTGLAVRWPAVRSPIVW